MGGGCAIARSGGRKGEREKSRKGAAGKDKIPDRLLFCGHARAAASNTKAVKRQVKVKITNMSYVYNGRKDKEDKEIADKMHEICFNILT